MSKLLAFHCKPVWASLVQTFKESKHWATADGLMNNSTVAGNGSRWDWLVAKGMNAATYRNSQAGFDSCAWRKLISSPIHPSAYNPALSEIIVVAIQGPSQRWRLAIAAANYLDLLGGQLLWKLPRYFAESVVDDHDEFVSHLSWQH